MIEYCSVSRCFGQKDKTIWALKDINLLIPKGKTVVFLGPSGCGKTTLLRLTNKLEQPTHGHILIDNEDIATKNDTTLRKGIGYVIQDIGLFPNKTIAENISVVPNLLGWQKAKTKNRVDKLLELVKLDPETYKHRYPAELSGGQQQRIGVARGLAADPKILLMDEPFGAIDPINREQIQNEFLDLQEKLKKTVVFVSHDIHEAIKVGDQIALFRQGELVQYDTPEVLLTQPKNKFVTDFVGADRALKALGLMFVKDVVDRAPKNIVPSQTNAQEALRFLEDHKLKFGIVVNQDKPCGYITKKTLKYENGKVKDLANAFPAYVQEKDSLRFTLSNMLMHDFSTFCVVGKNNSLVGLISYQNIQKAIKDIYSENGNGERF